MTRLPIQQALPLLPWPWARSAWSMATSAPAPCMPSASRSMTSTALPSRPKTSWASCRSIVWALILIISIKYLVFVLRADNRGEGGILALTALVTPMRRVERKTSRWLIISLGLFGTALLYGDGMITPAISVLSAVEGLEVATPFFRPYILPITVVILMGLFLFQSRGTESVGQGVWSHNTDLVHHACAARDSLDFAPARGARRHQPDVWAGLLCA